MDVPLVFLDLNHFIKLAQCIKNGTPDLFDRYAALEDLKKITLITTGTLYFEILKITPLYRRLDVNNIVKRLTKGRILCDMATVQQLEIANLVGGHFGLVGCNPPASRDVITNGYINFAGKLNLHPAQGPGIDPKIAAEAMLTCQAYVESGEAFEEMIRLETLPDFDLEGDFLQHRIAATENTRKEWSGWSFSRKEKESINAMNRQFCKVLDEVLPSLNLKLEHLTPSLLVSFQNPDFIRSVPSLDIWSKLHLHLYHRNLQAKVERTDMMDVTHLSVALTYCDVVVCDGKMASVIRSSKLDKQYNVKAFDDLEKAVIYLENSVNLS